MNYLVKNNNTISIMTVVSSMPTLPEGFEILGLASELNPNNLDVSKASLEEVEIQAAYEVEVEPAVAFVAGVDEVIDEETGEVITPAVEEVEAQDAVYETVPAVRGMRMVSNLAKARAIKVAAIRVVRDQKLEENDKQWLIATKKREDTTNLESVAQMLRDLPEYAATELAELTTLEEINGYNPFEV